jgi:hypothetical protein
MALVTGDQLLAHLIGDYVLQSDWMASRKRAEVSAAVVHAWAYALPFLFLRPSIWAWFIIVVTHVYVDHFGVARYVVWAKNFLAPPWLEERRFIGTRGGGTVIRRWRRNLPWAECQQTGYPPDRPVWLATWLTIVADNVLHIVLNGLALRYL